MNLTLTREHLDSLKNTLTLPKVRILLGILLLWMFAYADALLSAIRIWYTSEIYTHGFFVIPVALFLAWREKSQLAATNANSAYLPLPLLVAVTLLGVVSFAGQVNVLSHIAAFASLSLIVWCVLGSAVARVLWFPLLFIFFAVPIGDQLIPYLQQITADLAMILLNMTGIPIFRTGLYIEIPAGRFVVAEACSGIRFFIGSIVFGSVYAYISFRSLFKRSLFLGLSIIIPIIANAIRVFGIIMVGHFSNMEHATGADHLVYGWVFFAIVLFCLIMIGERFRDIPVAPNETPSLNSTWQKPTPTLLAGGLACLLIAAAAWKVWMSMEHERPISGNMPGNAYWQTLPPEKGYYWSPLFKNPTEEGLRAGDDFIAYRGWYAKLSDTSELVSDSNRLYDPDRWSRVSGGYHDITLSGHNQPVSIGKLELTDVNNRRITLYYWYDVNGEITGNKLIAKFKQTWDVMLGNPGAGQIFVIGFTSDVNPNTIINRLITP